MAHLADAAGALTLTPALLGTPVAFERVHHQAPPPHEGQMKMAAAHLRALLSGGDLAAAGVHVSLAPVQDAYSLRCMPQVHCAVRGALAFAAQAVLEIESGSATDKPKVFAGGGGAIPATSWPLGGNFHGAPLALAFDLA